MQPPVVERVDVLSDGGLEIADVRPRDLSLSSAPHSAVSASASACPGPRAAGSTDPRRPAPGRCARSSTAASPRSGGRTRRGGRGDPSRRAAGSRWWDPQPVRRLGADVRGRRGPGARTLPGTVVRVPYARLVLRRPASRLRRCTVQRAAAWPSRGGSAWTSRAPETPCAACPSPRWSQRHRPTAPRARGSWRPSTVLGAGLRPGDTSGHGGPARHEPVAALVDAGDDLLTPAVELREAQTADGVRRTSSARRSSRSSVPAPTDAHAPCARPRRPRTATSAPPRPPRPRAARHDRARPDDPEHDGTARRDAAGRAGCAPALGPGGSSSGRARSRRPDRASPGRCGHRAAGRRPCGGGPWP